MAQSLEGVITATDGKPISDALVEIHGEGLSTLTDANGRFIFEKVDSGNAEVHVSAKGFAHLHRDYSIPNSGIKDLSLTLQRSPIEVIDIVSTPLHLSIMESSVPVSVLSGETLRRQQSATLGDSLEKLVGVNTNFHAKVASTPIIRGLSGPRVLITQNGLDVSDVSRVGPDHSVASEASTASQIEVLRGPATLFYGSGAIGGVVNVVDSRVPTTNDTQGEWLLEQSSVDDQQLASFNITTGIDNFAFYADGFWRESDDYEIPVMAESEEDSHSDGDHEHSDEHGDTSNFTVENSAEKSHGFTLGTSYLFEKGFLGIAVEQLNREYGIPGHSHDHGDDEHGDEHEHGDDEHEEEHGSDEEHSDEIFSDLEQTRVQILGEYKFDNTFISQANLKAGYTDYEHSEVEGGIAGTTFNNETQELRLDLMHQTFNDWRGGMSVHYKKSDVEARGSEAFTPPSTTEMFALAFMEERHFGDVLVQLGARVERITMETNDLLLPNIEAHGHDEDAHDEEHDDEHSDGHDHGHDHDHDHGHGDELEVTRVFNADHEFTPTSFSAGLVWDFMPGYNVGLSASRSQRAPSASELLSFGPHIGTRTFEVGALFELNDDSLGLTSVNIDLETANNIDLSFRKTEGDLAFVFNIFYNSVDNYYYQIDTGLFADDGHGHDEHEEHEHDSHDHGDSSEGAHAEDAHSDDSHSEDSHEGELPVFLFTSDDVVLHGFEAQVAWQVTSEFKAEVFSDFVRAKLKDGGDLPRTPPLRFGTQFSYESERLSAHLDITRYQSQDKIAEFETTTDGYTLVDASVSYDLQVLNHNLSLYLKGNNLTDTEARVHTSFLKNIAPRPGRNISVGITGYF
jgi:iron complex outermembrane receptor protein